MKQVTGSFIQTTFDQAKEVPVEIKVPGKGPYTVLVCVPNNGEMNNGVLDRERQCELSDPVQGEGKSEHMTSDGPPLLITH